MSKSNDKSKVSAVYRDGLGESERKRYDDKISLLGGCDPYEVHPKSWNSGVGHLPAITYIDIVNYLLFTPSPYTQEELKSFKALDAYNQFVQGWVRDMATFECNDYVVVTAKVLHSQRLREKPLRPWIISEKAGRIRGAHCNCMAGLGEACTHIAALLFNINASARIRDSRTVTQEKAYWMLPPTMKSVEYKEVKDIDFTSAATAKKKFQTALDTVTTGNIPAATPTTAKKSVNIPEATDEEMDSFFRSLSESGSKPVVLSLISPYNEDFVPKATRDNFPQVLTDLRDEECERMSHEELCAHCATLQVECTPEQSCAVADATKDQSKSKIWHRFRAGRITASRAKSVCRTNLEKPSQALIKAICYPLHTKFTTSATAWGCDHEKVARDEFTQTMEIAGHANCNTEDSGFVISTDFPFVGASPDGIFSCDCCGRATVEVKCPFGLRYDTLQECKYLEEKDGVRTLQRSHEYYYQVQTQLGCVGLERSFFVVWTEKEMHIESIEFDQETWAEICGKATSFFRTGILPELVGKYFTKTSTPQIPPSPTPRPTPETPLSPTPRPTPETPLSPTPRPTPQTPASPTLRTPLSTLTQSNNSCALTEKLYCICNQVEHGQMVACDNESCDIEWFHYQCVKIERAPRGKWYCPNCRKLPEFKRKRARRE